MTQHERRIAALERANPVVLGIIDRWLGLTPPKPSHDAGEPWSAQ